MARARRSRRQVSRGHQVAARLVAAAVRLTRTDLVRYAGASGDFNPIHHSEHFAAQVGLPDVVAADYGTAGVTVGLTDCQ